MRQIDFYEFAGVIAPGVTVILAAALIWPDRLGNIQKLDLSLGGFGFALLVAYVVGHLLQGLGNILESIWWKIIGGWPSDWPRTKKGTLLSEFQLVQLQESIRTLLGFNDFKLGPELPAKSWYPVFRQIYAAVRSASRDDRAHVFNGNYGMFRGVAAASLVACLGAFFFRGLEAWPISLSFALSGGLALFRMHRFAVHYARETLVQFITLSKRKGDDS